MTEKPETIRDCVLQGEVDAGAALRLPAGFNRKGRSDW